MRLTLLYKLSWYQLLFLSCLCIQTSANISSAGKSGTGRSDEDRLLRHRTLQAGPASGANITWTSCTFGAVLNSSAAGSASYTFGSGDCDANGFTAICECTGASANSTARVLISAVSSDNVLRFDRSTTSPPFATFTKARLKSTAADAFTLTNLTVFPVNTGNQTLTVTAYKAGLAISGSAIMINYVSSSPIHGTTLTTANFGNNYNSIDEIQVTSSIGFGVSLDNIQTAAALPVNFLYFNGQADGHNILLNWATALESNVKNFEIERSTDGSTFLPAGTVNSKAIGGNSSLPLYYSYTDILSQTSSPKLFYRLRESDLDSRSTYSPVLNLEAAATNTGLSVYPNPFRQQVTVTVESPAPDKAVISVTDISGRRLLEQVSPLQKGTNILLLSAVSQLGKGLYLFTIATGQQKQTLALVKLE